MRKKLKLILSTSLIFCILGFSQCSKQETKNLDKEIKEGLGEIGVKGLQKELERLDKFELPKDITQRGKKAIMLWENNTCDPTPILIYAMIKKDDENVSRAGMYFSDEDSDVVGFGIREVRKVPSAEDRIVEETYPIFKHSSPPAVWLCQFPVEKRTVKTRKDEGVWRSYVENPSTEVLPPIIVSIPDPNNVDVWVWLYDQAGNLSEPVKAVNEVKSKTTALGAKDD